MTKVLISHAEWLMKEENYTKKHIHGIFQDTALIKLGYYLNNMDYVKVAIERLEEQLAYAFPNKFVHVENSVGYHIVLIDYISRIANFLSEHENSKAGLVKEYSENANDKFVFHEVPVSQQEPLYYGQTMNKVNENTYQFSLNLEGFNKLNSKWYVYKEGASYDYIGNNDTTLTYMFTEPGEYTIIYRINDIYFGEIAYHYFNSIIME